MALRWKNVVSAAMAALISVGVATVGFAFCYRIVDTVNCADENLVFVDYEMGTTYWTTCEVARDYNRYEEHSTGSFSPWEDYGEDVCGFAWDGVGVVLNGVPGPPLGWVETDIYCGVVQAVPCP